VVRIFGLAGLAWLLAILNVPAAAPPPWPLSAAELQRLIEQLGDRNFRARELAERRLRAEGMPALPYLRKALGHRDLEVRLRAMRLIPGLEHAALVAPKRITLKIENQTISSIIDQVSKASGYKLALQNGAMMPFFPGGPALPGGAAPAIPAGKGEPRYTYSFVSVPFWEVMDRICRDANLMTVQMGYNDDTLRLYQTGGKALFAGTDGAFRYVANNVQLYRNIELGSSVPGASAPQESLTFNFSLFAEPRLPFLGAGEPRIEAAYDEARVSLVPKGGEVVQQEFMGGPFGGWAGAGAFRVGRRYSPTGYKQLSMPAALQLQRNSDRARMIKVLRGVVPVQILAEEKSVVIADNILSAKGKKATAGDLDFNIEEVKKTATNQYQVKFTVKNAAGRTDFNWMNTLYQRVELRDAKGAKYLNQGSNWHGSTGAAVTMTLNFGIGGGKIGPPAQFVYQQWITRQHDVQFEFRDIPLP